MMAHIKQLEALLTKVENFFAILCSLLIALMMLLISYDALGRYFLNVPFAIQYEFTTYYLITMIFMLGFSWSYREGAFVKVSFLSSYFSNRFKKIKLISQNLVMIFCFAVILWVTSGAVYSSFIEKEVIFGIIDWPVWLAEIWIPIGSLFIILRLAVDMLLVDQMIMEQEA